MMTALYQSNDIQEDSDSDDDFMVDNIMPQNTNAIYGRNCSDNNGKCQTRGLDNSFPSFFKVISKPPSMISGKLAPKRNIPNVNLYRSKIIKLETDRSYRQTKLSRLNCVMYDSRSRYDQLESRSSIDIYESSSNLPSPFLVSDQTHSVETSSNETLNDDPIITSVVLNDDKRFNGLRTSIDDNLLRPIRQKSYARSNNNTTNNTNNNTNVVLEGRSFTIEDHWYRNSATKVKRSRSIGLDDLVPVRCKEGRSNGGSYQPVRLSPTSISISTQNSSHSTQATAAVSPNTGHNKRKHLLQFIIDLLKEGHSCVNWTHERDKEFVITQPDKLAKLWANYKNNNRMTFDSLARSLRLYYAPKKLERISGKKNHYRILNQSNEITFNQ